MKPLAGAGRPARILLVEDNEDDVELTRLALARARLAVTMEHVRSGEECLRRLRREDPLGGVQLPDLVLLDLNMPRMDGREVLQAIVADARLRHLPVIVLTTSDADADVLQAYRLRCNSYVVKPVDFRTFVAAMETLLQYWLTVAVLPES